MEATLTTDNGTLVNDLNHSDINISSVTKRTNFNFTLAGLLAP